MTCYRKKLFPEIVQPDRVLELCPLLDLVHPVHVVGVLAKLELDRVGEVVETELSGLPRKLPLLLVLFLLLMVTLTMTLRFWIMWNLTLGFWGVWRDLDGQTTTKTSQFDTRERNGK